MNIQIAIKTEVKDCSVFGKNIKTEVKVCSVFGKNIKTEVKECSVFGKNIKTDVNVVFGKCRTIYIWKTICSTCNE